jgi:predicted nuclease of predicted toxin-antitoxin system
MAKRSLKFLVDVGVGKRVEHRLRDNGYDVKAVRDMDPRMGDEAILRIAAKEQRMVITMDKDFGELVYKNSLPHAGVLILRLEGAPAMEKVHVVEDILKGHAHEIYGKFCVYLNGMIRIRN